MTETPDAKTFDALAALAGKAYPEDTETIYTDTEALFHYERISRLADGEDDPEKVNEYDAQLAELRERIQASAWTFHLRGYAPKVIKAMNTEARAMFKVPFGVPLDESDERSGEATRWRNMKAIAETIVKVVNQDGEVDERHFDVEYVEGLEDYLDEGEFLKLQLKCFEMSFRALSFDAAVTPDFS